MSITVQYIILTVISCLIGFVLFKVLLKLIPKKVMNENLTQKKEVLKEAKRQSTSIINGSNERLQETLNLMAEEFEEDLQSRALELKEEEEALKDHEENLVREQERLAKVEEDLKKKLEEKAKLKEIHNEKIQTIDNINLELVNNLEKKAGEDASKLKENIKQNYIESRQLEAQKVIKELMSDLDSNARKKAQRVLDRAQARYSPNFYWPKAINSIEIPSQKLAEKLADENCQLIKDMKEISGVEISVNIPKAEERFSPSVKLAGGFGIHKEAAKLALTQLIKNQNSWNKAQQAFNTHNEALENEATQLGKDAVNQLKLPDIHPEIQRLIGALNWRTSYRQNQWFHTVEVGTLAGIIGSELGVDPAEARRVGLLHDIGKAIDYCIEGSHAVISGDYADRFGENKIICDTVMSHHSDIVIETPLAYVLRVADTLSGARPGARVNLEEGYQIRLGAIAEAVRSFRGISDLAIMNGGREVHVQVNHKKVKENQIEELTKSIVKKIEEDVAFPGQIKVLVSRQFESVTVA